MSSYPPDFVEPPQPCCVCGHYQEEHGHDAEFPGSTACAFDEGCKCIAFEADS